MVPIEITNTRVYTPSFVKINKSLITFLEKPMQCAIYKGKKRPDDYLYVEKEDDFSRIPQTLLDIMGELQLVISLELSAERRLAQADVTQVMQQLSEQGYYLQIPPKTHEIPLNEKN